MKEEYTLLLINPMAPSFNEVARRLRATPDIAIKRSLGPMGIVVGGAFVIEATRESADKIASSLSGILLKEGNIFNKH